MAMNSSYADCGGCRKSEADAGAKCFPWFLLPENVFVRLADLLSAVPENSCLLLQTQPEGLDTLLRSLSPPSAPSPRRWRSSWQTVVGFSTPLPEFSSVIPSR